MADQEWVAPYDQGRGTELCPPQSILFLPGRAEGQGRESGTDTDPFVIQGNQAGSLRSCLTTAPGLQKGINR